MQENAGDFRESSLQPKDDLKIPKISMSTQSPKNSSSETAKKQPKDTKTKVKVPKKKDTKNKNLKENISDGEEEKNDKKGINNLAANSKKISKAPSDHENKSQRNRRTWSEDEDRLLIALVSQHGFSWTVISSKMKTGRTGKQIRDRYLNILDPRIKNNPWTVVEDQQLVQLYQTFGKKWKEISNHMDGRTEAMVKNRFYSKFKTLLNSEDTSSRSDGLESSDSLADTSMNINTDISLEAVEHTNENKGSILQSNLEHTYDIPNAENRSYNYSYQGPQLYRQSVRSEVFPYHDSQQNGMFRQNNQNYNASYGPQNNGASYHIQHFNTVYNHNTQPYYNPREPNPTPNNHNNDDSPMSILEWKVQDLNQRLESLESAFTASIKEIKEVIYRLS